ncbi:hypothetical protein [Aliamphritea spongicola]|nr:hypothetical protein [Aliamphritea spongicola]
MQTQNVTYGLDSSFVRKTKKKIIFASLFYIVPGCLIVGFNLLDFDYVKALLGMPLIVFGVHKFKEVRYWKENSSKIKLEISADHILVVDSKEKRSIKPITLRKLLFNLSMEKLNQ